MRIGLLILALLCHSAVNAQSANRDISSRSSDPIEPVNRVIWDFNYKVMDNYIYRPVTEVYVDWMPSMGRTAVNNFVLNFEEPSTVVNNLIQFEFKYAGDAFVRFAFNTTFGLFGLIDVAGHAGVDRRRESFSNVLGHWSVPNGPYLMVPIIGPRTTRKLVGNLVDGLYFPGSYLSLGQRFALWGADGLEKRASLLGQEPFLEQSLDSYQLIKNAYLQYEEFKFTANSEDMDAFIKEEQERKQQQTDEDLEDFMDEID